METAVEAMESMEMAPGALPRPGRVPEQRLLSPKICQWWRRSCRTLSQKAPIDLGFGVGRLYIGGEATSEGGQGAHTTPSRGQEGGRASPRCGCSLAPLRLPFGLRLVSGKNRRFGLRFVQFREYFLCSFSETKKHQKTGNWHCGISSIG
jgi:hypothetical protein